MTDQEGDDAIVAEIAHHLDGRSVATAESCTSGAIACAFSRAERASEWFRGGVVAYQVAVKRSLLGVTSPSVYCEDAAAEMANGAAHELAADVAVAVSGVAGAEPVDGQAPGTVFLATRVDGRTRTIVHHFDPATHDVLRAATTAALVAVRDALVPPEARGPAEQEFGLAHSPNG